MSEVIECATQSNIHQKIETLPEVSSNEIIKLILMSLNRVIDMKRDMRQYWAAN